MANGTVLNIDPNKGLLFPTALGCTGAVRFDGVYFEVNNSTKTTEGEPARKFLNFNLKKLGGRKSVDVKLRRSNFTGEKAPQFISNNFVLDNVEYQIVGWSHTSANGRNMIGLAVNEVEREDFDL